MIEVEGGDMLNIPDLSDVLAVPSPCQDFCCEIVASPSCHHLGGVGIDQELGFVHVYRRESLCFDGVVCHAIAGRRMAQGPGAKGERWP